MSRNICVSRVRQSSFFFVLRISRVSFVAQTWDHAEQMAQTNEKNKNNVNYNIEQLGKWNCEIGVSWDMYTYTHAARMRNLVVVEIRVWELMSVERIHVLHGCWKSKFGHPNIHRKSIQVHQCCKKKKHLNCLRDVRENRYLSLENTNYKTIGVSQSNITINR